MLTTSNKRACGAVRAEPRPHDFLVVVVPSRKQKAGYGGQKDVSIARCCCCNMFEWQTIRSLARSGSTLFQPNIFYLNGVVLGNNCRITSSAAAPYYEVALVLLLLSGNMACTVFKKSETLSKRERDQMGSWKGFRLAIVVVVVYECCWNSRFRALAGRFDFSDRGRRASGCCSTSCYYALESVASNVLCS